MEQGCDCVCEVCGWLDGLASNSCADCRETLPYTHSDTFVPHERLRGGVQHHVALCTFSAGNVGRAVGLWSCGAPNGRGRAWLRLWPRSPVCVIGCNNWNCIYANNRSGNRSTQTISIKVIDLAMIADKSVQLQIRVSVKSNMSVAKAEQL